MKRFISILLLSLTLAAENNQLSLTYTSLTYKDTPENHFLSLYLNLEEIYSLQSGDLELRVGLQALGILNKSNDFTLFDTIDKNRALLHSLSLDYYPTDRLLLSLGRQLLDINLLRGSFDGFLGVATFDTFSLKAFYFDRYSILDSTYYKNAEIDALYGFNFNYNQGIIDSEITYYTYYDHTVSNLYLGVHPGNFSLGAEYLSFTSDLLNDEKAYKFNLGYQYQNSYMEIGYFHVYEGTLRNIFALGGTEFKNFQLQGFLDQKDAEKIYLNLKYKQNGWYANLYYGYSTFTSLWDPSIEYTGKELGVTLSKKYGDLELSTSLLTQKSDQPWIDGERTTWLQTQLKVRF